MLRPRILAVTYSFPPMACPQSIQVARFIDMLNADVVVVCGDDPLEGQDQTIDPQIDRRLEAVRREPFRRSLLKRRLDALSNLFRLSWSELPDPYRSWAVHAEKAFARWQRNEGYRPHLILTFGMPMSDHLFGLWYKARTGVPWIAHFSDPWADNPFRRDNMLTRGLNRRMEEQVLANADAIIFTSPETAELTMKNYPDDWRQKVFCIPHSYDAKRFDPTLQPPEDRYVIRFIGSFYGPRSPAPIFEALEDIAHQDPELIRGLSVELVGSVGIYEGLLRRYPILQQIVHIVGMVTYAESLRLMQTAHCLLVIDAPAEVSVFFPSKLVEYIGADRFILAISPQGTTARVVEEVGGLVADPADVGAVRDVLQKVLTHRPSELPRRTDRYSKDMVCKEVARVVETVLAAISGGTRHE